MEQEKPEYPFILARHAFTAGRWGERPQIIPGRIEIKGEEYTLEGLTQVWSDRSSWAMHSSSSGYDNRNGSATSELLKKVPEGVDVVVLRDTHEWNGSSYSGDTLRVNLTATGYRGTPTKYEEPKPEAIPAAPEPGYLGRILKKLLGR